MFSGKDTIVNERAALAWTCYKSGPGFGHGTGCRPVYAARSPDGSLFYCHIPGLSLGKRILYISSAQLVSGGAQLNKQLEGFTEEKREEIVDWILAGRNYYQDDIEYVGDWVRISIYLPE